MWSIFYNNSEENKKLQIEYLFKTKDDVHYMTRKE